MIEMGVNSLLKELFALNMLKRRGYSLVEIQGNDSEVRTYIKRIEGNKSINIGGREFIINGNKKMVKGGMPLYRFHINKSSGETNGNVTQTKMDSDLPFWLF